MGDPPSEEPPANPAQPDEPPSSRRGDAVTRGRAAFDAAYARADRVLDRGQRRVFRLFWVFIPETSIARDLRFEQVMVSRFLSDAAQQSLAYGALIAVVREGGSTLEAALVGVAALLPPALLGLYGGAVADALPKRVALAAIYNLQAALCVAVPFFLGTDLLPVLLLIFAVNVLGQVSGPTESSVLPLVASDAQLASAASMVSLASTLGTAFGTALLAPVLVRAFGVNTVMYVAAGLLVLAASRVFDLSTRHDDDPERKALSWRRPNVNALSTVRWLAEQRAIATMILVAVLAGTVNIVVQVLGPRYVQAVLGQDPADAVYVLGTSAIGLAAALVAAPWLIARRGERVTALLGFALSAASLCLLGLVDDGLARAIDPFNPLRLLNIGAIDLSARLRTATLLAVPLGFGISTTTLSVQTYINRRVPLAFQGRAFALQSTLKNGTAIIPLLGLGAAASAFGVANVLIASPVLLLALAVALVFLSARLGGHATGSRLEVLSSFWEEPDAAATPGAKPAPATP